MELTNLNHCTSLIPSSWEWASLVLHPYDITNLELGKGTGVLRPLAEFCLASGSHSGFPVVQQLIPVWMEMELAREDRDEILDRPGEYCHGRGDLCDGVWGVAIGEYGSLEAVAVKFSIVRRVACKGTLYGLDTDFRAGIAMRVGDRAEPVVNTPVNQELFGSRRCKFRAAICGEVVRDAKSDEDGPEVRNEASGAVGRTFDDGPSRKAVDDNHIGVALVVKAVGA